MHLSGESGTNPPSLMASVTRGRGRVIAGVALLVGLVLSSLLAYQAMRAPSTSPTTGHVTGPR
jgi:hypothetical protein